MPLVELRNVTKQFRLPTGDVYALADADLAIEEGEFVAAKGPSGSGKSTLLLTVGGMARPTSGLVRVDGTDVYALTPGERAKFRAENIGFVFQTFHLVPYLSVLENVLLPTLTDADSAADRGTARELLERFQLGHRAQHRPAELSIGERQRAALARALLNRPRLLLADEPTGNLDPDNATEVMEYLRGFQHDGGTVLVVSHDQLVDGYAQRVIRLREGRLVPEAEEQLAGSQPAP
jgi:putative ABC transport system ATP-binding protein